MFLGCIVIKLDRYTLEKAIIKLYTGSIAWVSLATELL
jgi:hypothetical protein